MYNAFLKSARLRPMMLWGALLGCAVGLTPLLLVEGINRQMGISDRLFAMVDSALLASIGQVLMMPTLVLSARWGGMRRFGSRMKSGVHTCLGGLGLVVWGRRPGCGHSSDVPGLGCWQVILQAACAAVTVQQARPVSLLKI